MENLQDIIASNLRTLRDASGLTQYQVADHLSITQPAYAHYEIARVRPPLEVLMKLKDLYGLSSIESFFITNCIKE